MRKKAKQNVCCYHFLYFFDDNNINLYAESRIEIVTTALSESNN